VDGKNHSTQWGYDSFGRNTNVIDATGATVLRFKYDQDGRLTNRWSAAKGDTFYTLDLNGNATFINYPNSPDITFAYDGLNRVTNMMDAAGTTTFTYTSFGALAAEDGPWDYDTVTFTYPECGCGSAPHLRSGLTLLQPGASAWTVAYSYDPANRLQDLDNAPRGFLVP
jgi:YD repeat-containing protein